MTPHVAFQQLVLSLLTGLVAAELTHVFTTRRERANRRSEQRIDYLIGAFRAFSKANHHPQLYQIADEVEQALADIQLFGTPAQIELGQRFANDLGQRQVAELDGLLLELRTSLRQELGVEPIGGRPIMWFEIDKKRPEADKEDV